MQHSEDTEKYKTSVSRWLHTQDTLVITHPPWLSIQHKRLIIT